MEIAELKQMQGVYGPLIDLMDVHETFYTAVENTANNRWGRRGAYKYRKQFTELKLLKRMICSRFWPL